MSIYRLRFPDRDARPATTFWTEEGRGCEEVRVPMMAAERVATKRTYERVFWGTVLALLLVAIAWYSCRELFFWSAWHGKPGIVRLLLALQVGPNIRGSQGETALFYAAANGHTEVARLLVNRGADV